METKKIINSARDVLVGKIPDPKAQVEQITFAMFYKFMDEKDKESLELGGKRQFFVGDFESYSWSKLMDPRLGGIERMDLYTQALAKMYQNPHIAQLFRDIYKDAFIPFRSPETLNLFLKEIDQLDYTNTESLGDAFEYLLSVMGSQGDAGQFRTPRHIIDFMVDVVDPQKTDTILDPACGTAGFLISSYKHIIKEHDQKDDPKKIEISLTPDEKKQLIKNFTGYDISPDMVRLSKVNMYLHGFPTPTIIEYDTLSDETRWDESFDIMLANPPFMTPKGGIKPHKRFSIQANRSEILFLDYIIEHLKPNGKAGVIVPEGVLHNNTVAYKKVRKDLIERNLLYAVVELHHGVFKPYASVKTHILFIDSNIAKSKYEILFVRVKNDGFTLTGARKEIKENDIPNVISILKSFKSTKSQEFLYKEKGLDFNLVSKETILNNKQISLIGRRYKAIKEAENSIYKTIKLNKSLVTVYKGKSQIESTEEGDFKFVVTAEERKTADHFDFDCKAVCIPLVSSTGHGHASVRRIHYVDGKFALANIMCAVVVNDEKTLLSKFLYYILSIKKDEIIASLMTGTSNVSLDKNDIYEIEIPLPKIDIQKQMVKKFESEEKIVQEKIYLIQSIENKINDKISEVWGK